MFCSFTEKRHVLLENLVFTFIREGGREIYIADQCDNSMRKMCVGVIYPIMIRIGLDHNH